MTGSVGEDVGARPFRHGTYPVHHQDVAVERDLEVGFCESSARNSETQGLLDWATRSRTKRKEMGLDAWKVLGEVGAIGSERRESPPVKRQRYRTRNTEKSYRPLTCR
jgi:hypothetical protein